MPLNTPILPPGMAKALEAGMSNTSISQGAAGVGLLDHPQHGLRHAEYVGALGRILRDRICLRICWNCVLASKRNDDSLTQPTAASARTNTASFFIFRSFPASQLQENAGFIVCSSTPALLPIRARSAR